MTNTSDFQALLADLTGHLRGIHIGVATIERHIEDAEAVIARLAEQHPRARSHEGLTSPEERGC
jgi:hypothetical protein